MFALVAALKIRNTKNKKKKKKKQMFAPLIWIGTTANRTLTLVAAIETRNNNKKKGGEKGLTSACSTNINRSEIKQNTHSSSGNQNKEQQKQEEEGEKGLTSARSTNINRSGSKQDAQSSSSNQNKEQEEKEEGLKAHIKHIKGTASKEILEKKRKEKKNKCLLH